MAEPTMRRQPRSFQARRVPDGRSEAASASNIRSRSQPGDVPRSVAALLSAIVPGLGQAFNRRPRAMALFLVPVLVLAGAIAVVLATTPRPVLLVRLVEPGVLQALLVLDVVLLGWRLVAVGHAFLDRRYPRRPGPAAVVVAVALVAVTVAPHLLAGSWIDAAQSAFGRIFQADAASAGGAPMPALPLADRINILIVGIDKIPGRTATLTDSMMVASLDPVGRTVSLVSLPRDLVNVPLGNGSEFGPKLNSLWGYAERHPDEFPKGGMAALESAVGALLGIRIDYYARMDFIGFVKMIDAVGGVDITVQHGFVDPLYDGYGVKKRGYAVTAGWHHFNGVAALAYARSRQATGESDFRRAERQQEVLLALRDKLLARGELFWRVPELLSTFGDMVATDVPVQLLPSLAAIVDDMGAGGATRVVIAAPLVRPGRSEYGSVQVPDLAQIRQVAAGLFTTPGTPPLPWPAASPSPGTKARASSSPAPAASAAP
jgi:polyisoprenyl-teichoic acid--peptidoglycan teichoic acid transferase